MYQRFHGAGHRCHARCELFKDGLDVRQLLCQICSFVDLLFYVNFEAIDLRVWGGMGAFA